MHVRGFMARLQAQVARIPDAIIFPFNIPTISGFGASAGFNFLIQDRSGSMSVERLGELSRQFAEAARKRPEIGNIFTSFDPRYPQVKVELDREKARKLGVPVNEAFQALASSLGGSYVNDFNRFGRLFRVYVQSEADYRKKPEDIGDIWVRSKTTNEMIPLGTLVTITAQGGTELTNRFNLLRSVEFQGVPARGYASGQALAALEESFKETMPPEMGFTYSSLSYQEKIAPPAAPDASWPRSCSSSCCSPRCTRAGGCPGPCCSARRSSPWAPSSASGSPATTTTSTSRSATSC